MLSAAVAVAGIGTSATFAMMRAATGNESNQFTTATICVDAQRDNSEETPGPMFYMTAFDGHVFNDETILGKYPTTTYGVPGEEQPLAALPGGWLPGDSAERYMTVTNCGNYDEYLVGLSASIQSPDIEGMIDPDQHALWDLLVSKYKVKIELGHQGLIKDATGNPLPLSDFLHGTVPFQWAIYNQGVLGAGGDSVDLIFTVYLDPSLGEGDVSEQLLQGQQLLVGFTVHSVQPH